MSVFHCWHYCYVGAGKGIRVRHCHTAFVSLISHEAFQDETVRIPRPPGGLRLGPKIRGASQHRSTFGCLGRALL